MASRLVKSLRVDGVNRLALRPVFAVTGQTPVEAAVGEMARRRIGCVLVMAEEKLVGIFTERDFLNRVVAPRLAAQTAIEQVMTPAPVTIEQNASVQQAIEAMESGGFRHLPAVDSRGRVVGILSVKDIVHYLVEYFPANVYNLPPRPDQIQGAREGA